jgi:hypothetical protein
MYDAALDVVLVVCAAVTVIGGALLYMMRKWPN